MIPADLKRALDTMPSAARTAIRRQCGGDWQRVVLDHDGVTVYNTRETAARARSRTSSPAARSAPPTPPPAPRPQKTLQEAYQALQEHARTLAARPPAPAPERPQKPARNSETAPAPRQVRTTRLPAKPTPPERVAPLYTPPVVADSPGQVLAPPPPTREDAYLGPTVVEGIPDPTFDRSTLAGVGDTATTFAKTYANGIPPVLGYQYLWEVAELRYMDEDGVDAAIRSPQRVEVRPESKEKGYPVLKFSRGDIDVILGFRRADLPMVIAAYAVGRADVNQNTGPRTSSGGGGSRGITAPRDGRTLAVGLRRMGCVVEGEEHEDKARVSYEGQDLGLITVATAHRDQVLNDWSRLNRRIAAIRKKMLEKA